jgi:hypothetical protein
MHGCSAKSQRKKVARMLRNHKELILNWFRADGKISNVAVEGLNLKAKLAMRKRMAIGMWQRCKSPCIIHLASCRNQSSPIDSAEEPLF